MIRETLSHYRIIKQLGEGGMGKVYLAEDTRLHRKVALKVLPAEFASNRDRMRRFEQEATAAAALNHPNIAHIYEIGDSVGVNFIAMEFIDVETLRDHMRGASMKVGEVLDVATQIAGALSAAHAAGIVHRDIKPENIMLRRDRIVKVLDFGLAKLTERVSPDSVDTEAPTRADIKTDPGVVMGTALYMSPEQARGLQVDARTDIFSLGVLIYEMVAGRLPFEGSNTNEIIASILNDREAPPLARYAREAPAELDRIVLKALRKDREERYQDVKDLLLDLKSLKERLAFEVELERSVPPSEGAATEVFKVTPSGGRAGSKTFLRGRGALSIGTSSSSESITSMIKWHKVGAPLVIGVLVLALAGIVYFFYFARTPGPIDSIAILPLINASSDPNTEYLSDGITESIISNLSELPHLRVMARATAFRFKGKEIDPQKVGHDLGVRAVLTGRLMQQGDSLVVRTELTNVADGIELWGAEYDRKLSDVLAVQQEISREISEKLRLRLTGEDKKRLSARDTTSAEAYQFYLRGRYLWNKRTVDGIKKALAEFQQAIDHDPNYALGYVGLADCYLVLDNYAGIPTSETLPKAIAAADRALQIDDSLAEAHTSLAFIDVGMWRWTEAEAEYKRAISLNPNYPTAHHWFSIYLRTKGQFDDAMREIKRAQELDPLSPVISSNLAQILILKNDFNSATEECKRTIELDPSFPLAHETLGWAYLKQRRYEEAIAEFQKALELSKASEHLGYLGFSYAVSGRRAEALGILRELKDRYTKGEAIEQFIAGVYVSLGDKDQAFAWLEKDFEQRSGQMALITWWFSFEGLRSDPRYADLERRMGLKP